MLLVVLCPVGVVLKYNVFSSKRSWGNTEVQRL